jgi:copper chaperone CopZ
MKSKWIVLAFLIVFSFAFVPKNTNDEVTTSFKVSGVCGMCKERIEESLYVTGVKSATWDKKTQMLTVSYKSKKITEQKLHQLVAEVGHDTEKMKANDKIYKALPDCCLYRDGVNAHDDK